MDAIAPEFRVIAVDGWGAGKSPPWPGERPLTLADEVALLEPLLQQAGERFALVGHSYGGAVALMTALRAPQRVSALALYEPTLFALVEAQTPPPNDVDGIRHAVERAGAALDAGDEDAAARHFIDYWMGEGAWAATPAARKPAIAASMRDVRHWAHALMREPTPRERFASLQMPVLLMTGSHSPLAARAVARRLQPVLPRCEPHEFAGLGHMAPIGDAEAVNARIASFLRQHAK